MKAFAKFSELSEKADIVHYHFPWPFMDLVHFVVRPRQATVVTYHSDIIRQRTLLKFYKPIMHSFLGDVDHIVSTSDNYLETSETLQKFKYKTSVIPIGIDKKTYSLTAQKKIEYWRNIVGTKFFLFVGALRYYKGLHILLEAVKNEKWPIIIVGAGPVESELLLLIKNLNLTNIQLLGNLPAEDRDALYQLCYAVVFPSYLRSEAFGITLLEGAMHGKPLVSSEIGTGTSYINIDGKTGVVVQPGDPDALKAALRSLWDNPGYAAYLGKNAAERFNSFFTAEKMANSYHKLYETLLKNRTK